MKQSLLGIRRLMLALGKLFIIMKAKIVTNPKILGGKPIIEGTRISVEFILNLLASGQSEQEILNEYNHITSRDIHACLRYAANSLKNEIYYELDAAE